jgi:hypothetical protein
MSHTYTNIMIHALFNTKERQPLLTPGIRKSIIAKSAFNSPWVK